MPPPCRLPRCQRACRRAACHGLLRRDYADSVTRDATPFAAAAAAACLNFAYAARFFFASRRLFDASHGRRADFSPPDIFTSFHAAISACRRRHHSLCWLMPAAGYADAGLLRLL